MSLPSPGFQTNVSSPAPRKADVVAAAAVDEVVAVAADQHVVAVAADDACRCRSPPSTVSLTDAGGQADALIVSLPPSALTTSESLAPSEPLTDHDGRQAGDGVAGPAPRDADRVVAVGAVDDDGVGLAVAGAAARRRRAGRG